MPKFTWGGKARTKPADVDVATLVSPATRIVALPVDGTAFEPTRAIIADKAGSCTITDFEGQDHTLFPLTGTEQHLCVTKINALATTTKVWGLY